MRLHQDLTNQAVLSDLGARLLGWAPLLRDHALELALDPVESVSRVICISPERQCLIRIHQVSLVRLNGRECLNRVDQKGRGHIEFSRGPIRDWLVQKFIQIFPRLNSSYRANFSHSLDDFSCVDLLNSPRRESDCYGGRLRESCEEVLSGDSSALAFLGDRDPDCRSDCRNCSKPLDPRRPLRAVRWPKPTRRPEHQPINEHRRCDRQEFARLLSAHGCDHPIARERVQPSEAPRTP
jgi:hypothetical protein